MLTVLVSTISNSQVFLLKKNVSSFCKCKSYSHFFSKNISMYAIFDDQRFNDTVTNHIVSFEQLGPGYLLFSQIIMQNIKALVQMLFLSSMAHKVMFGFFCFFFFCFFCFYFCLFFFKRALFYKYRSAGKEKIWVM